MQQARAIGSLYFASQFGFYSGVVVPVKTTETGNKIMMDKICKY
jgi:hypothetical protein